MNYSNEVKEEEFEKMMREQFNVDFVDVTPYHQVDHSHCWSQGKNPACGQTLEWHKVCCLCAIPYKRNT